MAQKRMVSDNICDTVTFTEMSASARALYLHLHCASDEDGCCSGAKVLKSAKLRNSALDELIRNGYAIQLVNTPPKERIVYLTDWHSLNRFHHELNTTPMYRTQLLETIPDIQNALFKAKNEPVFAPSIGKYSKDKSSIVKSSTVEESIEKSSTVSIVNDTDRTNSDIVNPTTVNTIATDRTKHDCIGTGLINIIPTNSDIVEFLKVNYYCDDDLANATAKAFIKVNDDNSWSYVKKTSWQKLLVGFLDKDRYKRFSDEATEKRKAEVEAKSEELRKEREQQAERERIQQERENYFRHDWNERVYINTSKDLINYIKSRRYTEYDYSLCSCLYDKLYVQHTLEEIFVETLFDKKIVVWDVVNNCIELNDYGIADIPLKRAIEQIKNDSWSEQYKPHLPELPKNDTTKSNAVIDDWQT